ncbi:unnamed protein product [Vitrella brassicaformis CCMP3155]|uniref:Uncharacterized protein n=1 Tax=Vitrella brassicaformis (strain CCMP3155) TaxID=1169540 RepID=A0A0G4F2N8_VITBC|nr:unnamed protein product [Vitrella brassicaformis CCMP3155]|eukprot:CEM06478.1 unnamed protein product [Vitrella brassicaformis CCMP3155]
MKVIVTLIATARGNGNMTDDSEAKGDARSRDSEIWGLGHVNWRGLPVLMWTNVIAIFILPVVFGAQDVSPADRGAPDREIFKSAYCQKLEDMDGGVNSHIEDFNATAVSTSNMSCVQLVEFLYLSRSRLMEHLHFMLNNVTKSVMEESKDDQDHQVTVMLNVFSQSSMHLSTFFHLNAALLNRRPECFDMTTRFRLLVGMATLKGVSDGEFFTLYSIMEGVRPEVLLFHLQDWLSLATHAMAQEVANLKTYLEHKKDLVASRPGDESYRRDTYDNVAALQQWHQQSSNADGTFTLGEALKRTIFDGWSLDKGLLRYLLRKVFPRDAVIADMGAGGGKAAQWLSETGLVEIHAFDGIDSIAAITDGAVQSLNLIEPFQLPRAFDWVMCLEVAEHIPPHATQTLLDNLQRHARHGIVMSWGQADQPGQGHINGRNMTEWVALVQNTTSFKLHEALSEGARDAATVWYFKENVGVFTRTSPLPERISFAIEETPSHCANATVCVADADGKPTAEPPGVGPMNVQKS